MVTTFVQSLFPYTIEPIEEEGHQFYEVLDEKGRCRSIQHNRKTAEAAVRLLQKYDELEYIEEFDDETLSG